MRRPCLSLHAMLLVSIAFLFATRPEAFAESAPSASAIRLVEAEIYIPTPLAFPSGLDALEVYADLPGRHPLVILTHGTANSRRGRMQVTPWSQLEPALWFAQRGYFVIVVVRRGYGRSGGKEDASYGDCGSETFLSAGEASAQDLKDVMKYAAKLPEVNSDSVISAGISTGGFAQAALVADPPRGLKAAISFAGGRGSDGHDHLCDLKGVSRAFELFGRKARDHGNLPMLWVYSENDHYFPPEVARGFDSAYRKGGGIDELVFAPPDGEDGHHLYYNPAAWSNTVAAFLKAHNLLPPLPALLPLPRPPDTPAPAGLTSEGAAAWLQYLAGAPFKAFATDGQGAWGAAEAAFDAGIAEQQALKDCNHTSLAKNSCVVVARTPGRK